jgi:hypothetical protein
MKLFSPACHFTSLRSIYSPQHSIFQHPQSVPLPYCERPCFTPIQNRRKITVFLYFKMLHMDGNMILLRALEVKICNK